MEKDNIEAQKWFNLKAMRDMIRAQVDRPEVADIMSHKEISEAKRKVREWVITH